MVPSETTRRRGAGVAMLGGFVLLAFLPAVIGGRFGPGAWYAELSKPWYTPPGWLFGPVWTVLYLMIGVSGWLFWRAPCIRAPCMRAPRMRASRGKRSAAGWWIYGAQLVLNAAWSWLFFGLHRIGWSLVEIIVLTALVFANAVVFHARSAAAGWLLVPYLVWLGFATLLNAGFWAVNP